MHLLFFIRSSLDIQHATHPQCSSATCVFSLFHKHFYHKTTIINSLRCFCIFINHKWRWWYPTPVLTIQKSPFYTFNKTLKDDIVPDIMIGVVAWWCCSIMVNTKSVGSICFLTMLLSISLNFSGKLTYLSQLLCNSRKLVTLTLIFF